MLHTLPTVRVIRWGVCLVIIIAIIAGLYVSGSPTTRRKEALDQQRVNNLDQITYAVDVFAQTRGTIPRNLADLVSTQPHINSEIRDPATGVEYEYYDISPATTSTKVFYQLCANFDLATSPEERSTPAGPVPVGGALVDIPSWYHSAGRTCFNLRVRTSQNVPAIVPKPGLIR